MGWYLDEGLATLRTQWRKKHPNAVVYTIADDLHGPTSNHQPEKNGPEPGQDAGEVDAADFMPGKDVSTGDLAELRKELLVHRDKRILYVIFHDTIVSSVVQPWVVRPYTGHYHEHLHVSVNDKYDANTTLWDIEGKPVKYVELSGDVPELQIGAEDVPGKTAHIRRLQAIANGVFGEDLDADGVYGPKSAAAVARIMSDDKNRTTANGSRVGLPEWRRILGVW